MKLLKHLIKPALGLFIIYLLISKGGLKPALIAEAFYSHPVQVITGFIIYTFLTLVAGLRWYLLLRCGIPDIRFKTIFSLHMIGLFFVTLLPGGTGGDVVKAYYIYREKPSQKGFGLTSIVMDRAVGVCALLSWGVMGILMNWQMAFTHPGLRWNAWFYLCMFILTAVIVILFFTPYAKKLLSHPVIEKLPGKKALKGLFGAIQVFREYPRTLLLTFLLTLGIHGSILITFYISALSLDVDLSIFRHSFVVPILMVINGLPLSPGGIGVGEAAAATLYQLMGVDKGGEILVFFHIYVIIIAFAGLPFYLLYKKRT